MTAPTAFALVLRGRFSIPAARGAVVGNTRVEIRDLGSVEPRPTIDDVRLLGQEQRLSGAATNIQFKLDLKPN